MPTMLSTLRPAAFTFIAVASFLGPQLAASAGTLPAGLLVGQPAAEPQPAVTAGAPAQPQPGPTPAAPETGTPAQPQPGPTPSQPEAGAPAQPLPAATPASPPPAAGGAPEDTRDTSSQQSGTALSGQSQVADDGLPDRAEVVGKQKKRPKNLSHYGTGGVSAGIGMGYGMVTAGDKYCGEFSSDAGDADGRKSLCSGGTPPVLDLGVAYGAHARIDVVVTVRVNLTTRDYDAGKCDGGAGVCQEGDGLFLEKRAIGVMPGIRLWGADNNNVFKVGGGIDLIYMHEDFQGYRDRETWVDEDADEQNRDAEQKVGDHVLGLRGGPVLQVDPHHNFGFFLMPAAVASFRVKKDGSQDSGWFETAFEAVLGVQARFP